MEVEGHGKNVSQTTAQERRTSLGNLSFPEFQSPLSIDTWEEFQARVKTYISIGSSFPVWMLKPLNLSPAFCAQYGWKCVDVDMVKCVTCAAAVCCHLPKPWRSSAVYQECVMELIKLLQKEGHKNSCPWPLIPSSENFVYMKKLHKKEAFREFDERLRSLMTIKNSLPPVSEDVLDKLEITNDTILHICQMAQISDEPEIQMAVLFAMTGWSKRETEGIDYLRCEHCLRESATHLYGSVSLENVETHGFEMSTESEGILVNLEDDTFSPGDTQKELDRKFMKDQAESHSSEGYLQIFVGDDVAEAVQEMVEGDSKETIKELIEDVMLEIINQTVKVVGVASDQKMVEEERAENMKEFLTSDTLKDTSGEDKEKTTLQDEVKKRSGIMKGTTENLVGYDSADTVHNVIEIEGINVKEITKNRTFKETVKCYKEEAVEELTGVEIEVSVKDFNMDKSVKHIFDDDKKETVEEHVGEAAAENLKEKKKKEIVEDTVQCENIVIFQKGGKKDDDGEETVEEYMEETTENVKKKIRNESDKTLILEKGMKTETSRGVKEITQNKIVKAILETNKEGTGEKPIEEEMTRDETFKDAVEDDRRESIQESVKEEMAERMKEHTRNETVQHVIEKYKAKYVKEIARNTTFSETIESDRKQNIEKLIEINLTESLKKIAKNQMAKEIKEENRVEMIKKNTEKETSESLKGTSIKYEKVKETLKVVRTKTFEEAFESFAAETAKKSVNDKEAENVMDITEESVLKSYETTEGSSVVSVKKPADYESSNAVKERAQEGPLDYFEEINMDDCAESVLKLKNTKEIMSISSNVKVDETNKQETMLNVPVDLSILDTSITGEAPPAVGSIVNLSEVEDTEESTKPIGCLNQSYVTSKQVLLEKPEGEQKAASLGTVKTTVGKETCKEEQSNRYFVKKPLVEMRLKRKSDSIVPEPARKKRCLKVKLPENFDLLGEHRPWCKWLIIHEVSGLAGWRIFIESLLRNLTEMSPSSSLDRNRVKIAVNLLSTWTYPVLRTEQLNSS